MWDCWSFTCCLSGTLGSLSKFSQLSLFCRYYFGRYSSEQTQLVPLPYSRAMSIIILIDYMIFLSPFLDVTRMSMLTAFFLAQLNYRIVYRERFPLTCDLNGFKSRINRHFQLYVLSKKIPACFNLFVFVFLVTPGLVLAIQPCLE